MNSRERVRMTLNHKQPDKIPVSLGSSIVDEFTKFAKDNFEKYLGLEAIPHVIIHKPMGTVVTSEAIMEKYRMDFRIVKLKAP